MYWRSYSLFSLPFDQWQCLNFVCDRQKDRITQLSCLTNKLLPSPDEIPLQTRWIIVRDYRIFNKILQWKAVIFLPRSPKHKYLPGAWAKQTVVLGPPLYYYYWWSDTSHQHIYVLWRSFTKEVEWGWSNSICFCAFSTTMWICLKLRSIVARNTNPIQPRGKPAEGALHSCSKQCKILCAMLTMHKCARAMYPTAILFQHKMPKHYSPASMSDSFQTKTVNVSQAGFTRERSDWLDWPLLLVANYVTQTFSAPFVQLSSKHICAGGLYHSRQ